MLLIHRLPLQFAFRDFLEALWYQTGYQLMGAIQTPLSDRMRAKLYERLFEAGCQVVRSSLEEIFSNKEIPVGYFELELEGHEKTHFDLNSLRDARLAMDNPRLAEIVAEFCG
jgi:hypothetical protein